MLLLVLVLSLLLLRLLLRLLVLVCLFSGSADPSALYALPDGPPDLIQHPHHNEDPENRLPGRRKEVQQHRRPKQQQKQRQ
jgi:hypothetical protein